MEENRIYFYTASIVGWKPILKSEPSKEIILNSLAYLVKDGSVKLLGYVIMPNHIHLIWLPLKSGLQLRFMKYTAQMLKFHLHDHEPDLLEKLLVNKKDRIYQVWQRNPQAKELRGRKMVEQKLDYLHNNPCQGKWMLVDDPTQYLYSSIRFYEFHEPNDMLTHYMDFV